MMGEIGRREYLEEWVMGRVSLALLVKVMKNRSW